MIRRCVRRCVGLDGGCCPGSGHAAWLVIAMALMVAGAAATAWAGETTAKAPVEVAAPGDTGRDAEKTEVKKSNEVAVKGDTLTVTGTMESKASGVSILDYQMLRHLSGGNGDLNELLLVLPDIQPDDSWRSAKTAGEILPVNISISGGKAYQNNFSVDGISNNSLLDPGSERHQVVNDVPGHPQEIFLDSDLVEEVAVYDSNVPARFGDFSGGVVDAKTVKAGIKPKGKVYYRTTRSQWTHFFQWEGEEDDEASLTPPSSDDEAIEDPRFEKHIYGGSLSMPLGDTLGALGSVNEVRSTISKRHFKGWKDEKRHLRNIMTKLSWDPDYLNSFELSLFHSPYEEERFLSDIKNSDYTIKGGGDRIQGQWNRGLGFGALEVTGGFRKSVNEREAPKDLRQWAATASKPWGADAESAYSKEGGHGDITKTQESFTTRADLSEVSFEGWGGRHTLSTGISYDLTKGTFDRKESTMIYTDPVTSDTVISPGNSYDCEDNEQYFSMRKVYDADDSSAVVNALSLYGQDEMVCGRVTLRPGLRVAANDFMDNLDVAPRMSASWDSFGDGRTVFTSGFNRYHSATFITYKLREAKRPYRTEVRKPYQDMVFSGSDPSGTLGGFWWPVSDAGNNVETFSTLKTPYADEFQIGVDQRFVGGTLGYKYVRRKGRDQFARTYGAIQPDGLRYYTMTNDGFYDHKSHRVAWGRSFGAHRLNLNVTYQDTDSSNGSYDGEIGDDRVWYGDEVIYRAELPKSTFNKPWMANVTAVVSLPARMTLTTIARYRGSYTKVESTGKTKEVPDDQGQINPLTGEKVSEEIPVYGERDRPSSVVVDCKLRWKFPLWGQSVFTSTLEVNNLFNKKVLADGKNYELGRQFWLGGEVSF
ncbi:hypothetical protein [Desulfoluna butyratoxydans]|uniref:Tonb-dependent receptor beta-barrel n=1 Tax=Desulfoluna butyratoxydans TaxID=231438 RepID=A0A4U8YQW7_9BACT|nr:hypothetical protein [Desulfoluna butyratoxydans]VFQ46250.1 hypothetical protein MSL71_39130 [Desulfoluna butyratoxydans]